MDTGRKKDRRDASRWDVQRERLRLRPGDRVPKRDRTRPIATVLSGVLDRLGLQDSHWLTVLEEEWSTLVGDAVAAHSRPGRVERGRLIVFVDSSVWLSELSRYGLRRMTANLQARFGRDKIKEVMCRLDPEQGRKT